MYGMSGISQALKVISESFHGLFLEHRLIRIFSGAEKFSADPRHDFKFHVGCSGSAGRYGELPRRIIVYQIPEIRTCFF